jgi:hypothetical protein
MAPVGGVETRLGEYFFTPVSSSEPTFNLDSKTGGNRPQS